MQRYGEVGTETFYLAALKVPPNTEVHISYGEFEDQGEGFYAFADHDIDGTVDKTYKILFDTDPFEWGE